jgi:hypothetical protein
MDYPWLRRGWKLVDQDAVSSFPALGGLTQNEPNHLRCSGSNRGDGRTYHDGVRGGELVGTTIRLVPGISADLNGGLGVALVGDGQGRRHLTGRHEDVYGQNG